MTVSTAVPPGAPAGEASCAPSGAPSCAPAAAVAPSFGQRLKAEFGRKVYKLSLDIGCTCPTRDGTKGTRGCIFCSQAGSGDFAVRFTGKQEELDLAKSRLKGKIDTDNAGFIAYFQNFTNTYAPVTYLETLFTAALKDPSVVALSIATRPDCLGSDVIEMIRRLCLRTTIFVELGLQTIHPATAAFIRRGFDLREYDDAVVALHGAGARVVTHLIFGLPYPVAGRKSVREPFDGTNFGKNKILTRLNGFSLVPNKERKQELRPVICSAETELALESREMMLGSVRYVVRAGTDGVKFQLLHVLKGTDLADLYLRGAFRTLTFDEYKEIIKEAAELLPPEIAIHRLTGDPPRKLLIAPQWCTDKKRVLNEINRKILRKAP
jgi:radical SAM superfamily enzyme